MGKKVKMYWTVEKIHQIKKKNMCRRVRNKKMRLRLAAILIIFAVCVPTVLCMGIPALPVIAAAQTTVTLTAEGNQAEVSLVLPSENQSERQAYSGIKALQLGFQVNILHGEGESYNMSFLFDEGITSSVKQFSYQEETGLLQIYLSGEQNLYEGGRITLGKIVVESNGSADVTAGIRVAEDSLKTVNDAFDLQEQSFQTPEMVQVTTEIQQTVKDSGVYGGAAVNNTAVRADGQGEAKETEADSPQNEANQSEGGTAAAQNGNEEKSVNETAPASGGSDVLEQEPLLRLVETEKRSGFSPNHFSFQSFFADTKARIVLGIMAVAVAALILGTIIRAVHNRKRKKKTWW